MKKNGSLLKPRKVNEKKPYYMLNLVTDDGKYQLIRVHRLVAIAFVRRRVGMKIVNYIDGNKQNNVATNLEWADNKGNNKHAYDTGLRNGPTRKFRKVIRIANENEIKFIRH
ncbi:hypothetical protein [Viridibacillus arvi]|uniref:hypothetical protein n=1 Tax=Viridibacillus arvi TaxID=263475 RepID=UPI003CFEE40A